MKVYVTKYALTRGIEELDATDVGDGTTVKLPGAYGQYLHKREWYPNRQDAVWHAESMRDGRIASLEKQLAKLKAMRFT